MKHDWEYKKLGDYIKEYSVKNKDNKPIPVYSVTNSQGFCKEYFNKEVASKDKTTYKIVPYGFFAYNPSRINVGSIDWQHIEDNVIVSPLYNVFSVKKEIRQDYLLYFLKSSNTMAYINVLATGTVRSNLKLSMLKEFTIPVPALAVQERIVGELDKVSEIIEKKKEQVKGLDSLAQSMFYEMFGDPVENEKGWEVKKYGKVFIIGAGGTPSKSKPEYWEGGDIPWIGSNMCQNQIIYQTDGKYITNEGLSHSSAKVLEEGTVLVALVGATIGKVGLLKTKTATNQNVAFIKVNENQGYNPYFVYYQLQSLYGLFMSIGNGDFKMANQGFIKDLPIITPPLSLQQAFAEKIEGIEKQKELITASLKEAERLFDARMEYWFGE